MTDAKTEPIAITGIGLRFPGGADDTSSFWKLMCDKVDCITEIPDDRWSISRFHHPTNNIPGKTYSKWGGFLTDLDQFDAPFFGLSAQEAENMDPQQRLLLEAAWHALEDSGHPVTRRDAANIGVFVGISTTDYRYAMSDPHDFPTSSPFSATGGATSIAANRISHVLNLKGPSIAVDTACSSSLVAFHLACRSILDGECEQAIVGGVNAILDPGTWIAFCNMSALSKDGRCKTFDAGADGFVRSEGVGAVVLKPFSQAVSDYDRVYAVVRATALNQDGWTPAISMPSREAQELLILQTCRRARISPGEIAYVEAHGTGTAVGDPIEANAIGNTIGKGRAGDDYAIVGSVKTNIGHSESAAGIASIIKTALVLFHRQVPPNIHFHTPNPAIDFDGLHLRIPTELLPLPQKKGEPAFASVNSFGFGGTNAHVVLETPPSRFAAAPFSDAAPGAPGSACSLPMRLLAISAQSTESLGKLAAAYRKRITEEPQKLDAICRTAALHRARHRHSAVILGKDAREMADHLAAFGADETLTFIQKGNAPVDSPHPVAPVFVFSGQGCQWHAMGRSLLKSSPVFREKIQSCHDAILTLGGFRLIDELLLSKEESRLHLTEIAQPAIFSVQVALSDLWQSLGVTPAAVVGHSVGEVAAACVSGSLSLKEAVRVIYHRGRTMAAASEGKMIAVGISAEQAASDISPYGERLSLAAINSRDSVTISGDPEPLADLVLLYEARNVFCRYVRVSYAFHSAHMDPVRNDLLQSLVGLDPSVAKIPVYSTVTGGRVDGSVFTTDYWWRNVRQTVRFAPAIEQILKDHAGSRLHRTIFVELGGHPVLSASLNQCLRHVAESQSDRECSDVSLASLRRDTDDWSVLLPSLARLICEGLRPDWKHIYPVDHEHVSLPLYPWTHQGYWLQSPTSKETRLTPISYPFLIVPMHSQDPSWHTWPDGKLFPYLNDHWIQKRLVFPGAGYVELALESCAEIFGPNPCVLEEIEFQRVLYLPDGAVPTIRVLHEPDTSTFEVHSTPDPASRSWTRHATGGVRLSKRAAGVRSSQIKAAEAVCTRSLSVDGLYQALSEAGMQYGPLFRGLKEVRQGRDEAWARIVLPPSLRNELPSYRLHPVLLDSAFQLVIGTLSLEADQTFGPYMPVFINRLRFYQPAPAELQAHARLTKWSKDRIEADIFMATLDGCPVAAIEGFSCQSVGARRTALPDGFPRLLHTEWDLLPFPHQTSSSPEACLPPLSELAGDLQTRLSDYVEELGIPARFPRFAVLDARLTASWIEQALMELGLNPQPGETLTVESMLSRTFILPRYRQLLHRWLLILARQNLVKPTGNGEWRIVAPWGHIDRASTLQELLRVVPGAMTEVEICNLCGERLADILSGKQDVLQIFFAPETAHVLDKFYMTSICMRPTNFTLRELAHAVGDSQPEGRLLRILELGAGTGGSTASILPELPEGHFRYTFTDLSEAFFSSAEEKFQGCTGIDFRKLDITKDPGLQGFSADYDLVIAIDVIHATPDLRSTLRNVQTLLRPGGWFVLGEIDTPFLLLVDMVFGLTDGWWSFQDHDLRPDYPLLRRNQWLTLLKETGFQEVRVVSESQDESIPAHGVYLMKAPATPAPLRASSGSPAEEEILPAADGSEPTARSLEPRPLSMLPGVWILLADSEQDSVALQLSRRLTERGHTAKVIPICESGNPWDAARTALDGDTLVHGVIYLAALTMPEGNDFDTATLLEQHRRFAHLPVALAQGLAGADILKAPARLWFVTRNALAVKPDDCPDCMQAPLQGLSRVVDSGLREFNTCAVDLSAAVSDTDLDLFCEELFHSCREDQIAYRGEGRYVPTLRRALPSSQRRTRRLTGAEQPCRLSSRQSGVLDHLALQTMGPSVLGEDEVEVEVRCAALNFRDIMKALRIYPSDAPDAEHIGDEYSGVITRVGARVTSFKPGDRVCGTWTGTFRSHLVLPAFAVLPIPDNLTFEEASTPIVAFDTAYTALHRVAHIQSGERLLIHSAAGGVGLAALYLGMSAGAEVFTTAGTPLKRDFLRNLGVHHVFDSHSLEFADEIMEVTGGEGVDVVLNSLAGEAIAKGLSCLRWGGRFVEIGKRDVYGNTRLGLRPFQKGLSFTVLDLSARLQPDRLESAISDLSAQFRDGKIDPLPYRALSFGQPSVAFRYMAQGKHIGKIVLSLSRERFSPAPILKTTPLSLSPDETYLITGGLRGFGQAIGRYLCEKGARHFVLISRSGQPDAEGAATIDFLRTSGATVRTYGVDVASYDDMRSLLDEVRRDMPPLGGILHAAVVYADELLIRMTADKFEEATRPKMLGAWNLHLLTLEDPVHTFILFSSISTVIATPTQPNYVAANTFLEELIHYRRRIGKPGLAVSWDRLRDTGYVARSRDFAEHAQRMGWHGITTAQALQALESLIVNEAAHMCVCDFDFGSWANHATFTSRLNRFREVVAEDTAQVTGDRSQRIRQEIYSSSPEQRMGRIETFLIDQVAHILRVPPGKIDGKAPLNEQGLDSLMAVELLSVLEGKLGIPIPTSHMVNAPTIEQLSGKVLELLQVESSAPPSTTAAVVVTPTPPLRPPDLSAEEGAVQDLPRLVDFVDAACPTFPSFPALLPPPRKILLTGANGFIGAYLLDSLLRGTEAEVLCLVRAESDDNAAQRIIHSADIYHLASVTTHGHDRWQAIAGDLDQSAFGLSPERFARLADEVDAVGHLGAAVSHIAGYQQLRRTNVLGTLEVIRLASLGKPKLIHFASSVAVFDASGDRKLEDQPPDDFAALHGGYGQSKAVCERLLVHGRSRGLRATIYRIGPVAADVLTGAAVQRDFVWLIAQTSLELGVAPRSDLNIYLTPIDFVARVMNRAMSGNLSNQTLHLVSPHSISFDELFDAAEAYGYEFSRVTPSEWVEQAKRTSPVFPLAPYFAFGKETVKWISRATNLPKLDASRLLTFAQSEGLQAAPLDRKTRIALVESLARSGVLPPRNKPKAVK